MSLHLDDFAAWSEAVHGQTPFPWQTRLLAEVVAHGWPDALKLPTASGKTTALDVAVFALALEAQARPAQRRMPMRIALVVDRRIVVDGAFARAERIRRALEAPSAPVVAAVAEALRGLGGDRPLDTALLRGGIYREDRWARQPNQPTILCSTVDQVGSRLLHRGYGLSARTWPIHAGLLGHDALILLDEAHVSAAFLQTLRRIAVLRTQAESPLPLPWCVTAMTATPREEERTFTLDDADLAHPVMRRRLVARRPLQLVTAAKSDAGLVDALCEAALAALQPGRTVLAVVNRVRTARALHAALSKGPAARRPEAILLTGRARPVERDALLARHADRLMAGRDREAVAALPGLVVVATQCVEVGADLDVDALVTEACPLDALRQRLGRLNRLGALEEAPCTVVSRAEFAWAGGDTPPEDVIYGTSVAETWRWLSEQATEAPLDGGAFALDERAEGHPPELDAPCPDAPTLFPAYCDLWAQTGPEPASSPSPAPFLHGPERGAPEVQLCWRADLADVPPERWAEAVALCAPVAAETLAVPLAVVRAWLDGTLKASADDTADLEGLPEVRDDDGDAETRRFVLCWRGLERSVATDDPAQLAPGDTLVVPISYGGCNAFGWAPASAAPVEDLADRARVAARRAPALRLHPAVVGGAVELAAQPNAEQPDDLDARVDAALAALAAGSGPHATLAAALRADRRRRVDAHPSGVGYVVGGRAGWAEEARDFSDEDDTSSTAPAEVTLTAHLADVRDLAREFATAVGLDAALADDVALAAHLHDLGKADPRFQTWLREGDRLAALRGAVLAKSPGMPPSLAARTRARERAGYPRGGRHELLSVRLAESVPALLAGAHDRDLVLHLVESHHGHCRPFAPVVTDTAPLTVRVDHEGHALAAPSDTGLERLDSGVAERFFTLQARYGWWGLSYLEATMRLADHRASERAERTRP
jgi:CRISPR-associated endonuclease/helicase Cas3